MRFTLLVAVLLILVGSASAQIFLGSVQGYVFNVTSGTIANATVNVSVMNKTGAGSSGSTVSDSGGFYIVVNLNANSGDLVLVQANKSNEYGTGNDTADSSGAAYVNITIFAVPFPPSIVPIADTHNNSLIIFNWTSGIDPQAMTTFDVFTLDGTSFNDTDPPQNRTFVSFINHTWSVSTCNSLGCSQSASDSFYVFNSAPPSPTLRDVSNTANNTIVFNWSSGGADPDGDATFFIFELDGDQTVGVSAPRTLTVSNGSHTWKVQECDDNDCSQFSTDTFTVTNAPPSLPNLTPMNATTSSELSFSWVSGVDPDGAATYDEFQLNNGTMLSNVSSPLTATISGIQAATWRVRTRDVGGACSAFAENTFVRFSCEEEAGLTPVLPGGRGRVSGGGGDGKRQPVLCVETWVCTEFEPCDPEGTQARQCTDVMGCGTSNTKPSETNSCEYIRPKRPSLLEMPAELIREALRRIEEIKKMMGLDARVWFALLGAVLAVVFALTLGWRTRGHNPPEYDDILSASVPVKRNPSPRQRSKRRR